MGLFSFLFGSGADEAFAPTPPPIPSSKNASDLTAPGPLTAHQITELARRHDVSAAAIDALAAAMRYSGGRSAQFSHPELGGMGQWLSGGMLMIGDMFNTELKAKVDRICRDVGAAIENIGYPRPIAEPPPNGIGWWPEGLGTPSSAGVQNAMRYAFFPAAMRLVVDDNGRVSIYDTGRHYLTGVSQQQGSTQTLSFTDTDGRMVELNSLERLTE